MGIINKLLDFSLSRRSFSNSWPLFSLMVTYLNTQVLTAHVYHFLVHVFSQMTIWYEMLCALLFSECLSPLCRVEIPGLCPVHLSVFRQSWRRLYRCSFCGSYDGLLALGVRRESSPTLHFDWLWFSKTCLLQRQVCLMRSKNYFSVSMRTNI